MENDVHNEIGIYSRKKRKRNWRVLKCGVEKNGKNQFERQSTQEGSAGKM